MYYNTRVIRLLLQDAFNAHGLWTFCYDRPVLREVHNRCTEDTPLYWMVQVVISYCEEAAKFGYLLQEVKQKNPSQFDRYKSLLNAPPHESVSVTLTFRVDKENLTLAQLDKAVEVAIAALAAFLGISCDEIRVEQAWHGSLILQVSMPAEAAAHLLLLSEVCKQMMQGLGIEQVSLVEERPPRKQVGLLDKQLQTKRVIVIGHRGAEALAPENTWAAFQAGYEAGADLLELDVQLTRDGEAIVFHDFTLQPKFGDPRWVRDMGWDELWELDVGGWFGPKFAGERIPRLADVLAWAQGRLALQIDLKHGFQDPDDDRLEMTALDLIEAAGMVDQVVISSWDRVALARVHARRPDIALAVNLRERVPDPVDQITPTGARWATLFWPQADRQTVARLQEAGLRVNLANLFTGDYAEALHLGVDAVTAGDPRAARAAIQEGQSR